MAPTCYCTSRWAMVPKKFIYITRQIKRNYKKQDNQFAKQENTFNVASDWLVLSADQAKKLGEYMEQHAADIKKEGTETVGKKMMAAMMANPSMSQEEQAKLTEQYTKEFQQELIQKILSDMK